MASNIKVGLEVNDNGNLRNLTKEAKALNGELTAAQKAARSIGNGMASGRTMPTKEENIAYRNARGVAGTGTGGSRDFAKQAQGLGGLVHLYATFAANIFAVTAAFTALDNAMQYTQMIKGAEALEASTGAALRNIAKDMVAVSDGALSMKESLKFSALASSAGITQKEILQLTKGAKGAALALGRDLGDAIDRVIRGVTKLEPELLDELGVTVKAQQAYRQYAASIGVSVDALSGYQKSAAYTIAVTEELTRKYGDVADKVEASPFNKFVGELKNAGTELLNLVNKVVGPVVGIMANNVELVYAGILLTVKSLASRALPEINKLFTVSPAVLAERKKQVENLISDLAQSAKAQKAILLKQADDEVAIQRDKIARLKSQEAQRIRQLAPQAFKNPNGQSARFLSELGSVGELDRDTKLRATITAGYNRESKIVQEIEKAKAAGLVIDEKAYALAIQRKAALEEIQLIVSKHPEMAKILVAQEDKLQRLENNRTLAAQESTDAIIRQGKASKAEIDLAKTKISLAKLSRDEAAQTARYLEGNAAAQLAYSTKQIEVDKARLELQKQLGRVQTTTSTVVRMGPNGFPAMVQESVDKVNLLGKASMKFGGIMDAVAGMAMAGAAKVTAALGWVGLIATALYALYAAVKYALNAFDALNKFSGELNRTLEEASGIINTATAAYSKYTENIAAAKYSLSATSDANSMIATTFDQVTDSINRQTDAFKVWQENQTTLSAWWDTAFGSTAFEKLRTNIAAELNAAARFAKNPVDVKELQGYASLASSATVYEELVSIKERAEGTMSKSSEAAKRENDAIKELTDGLKEAEVAYGKFNDQQEIKNEKLRKTVGFIEKLKSEKDMTIQLKMLAEVDTSGNFFKELPKDLKEIILLQQEIQTNEKILADLQKEKKIADAKLLQAEIDTTTLSDIVRRALVSVVATITEALISALAALRDSILQIFIGWGTAIRDGAIAFAKSIEKDGWGKTLWNAFKSLVSNIISTLVDVIINAIPGVSLLIKAKGIISEGVGQGIDNASKAKTAPKAPTKEETLAAAKKKSLELDTQIASQQAKITGLTKTQVGDRKVLNKLLGESAASFRAMDSSESSKRSKAVALQKEELKSQLEYQQAISKLLAADAKEEERRLGYVTDITLQAQDLNTIKQIDIRAKQQELDIEERYKRALTDSTMSKAKAGELRQSALKNLSLEVRAEKDLAEVTYRNNLEISKRAEYQQNVAKPLERQLELEKAILSAKKTLGAVTPVQEIKTRFELERVAALNTLNIAKAGAREGSIAVVNAEAQYDLTIKKLNLEEEILLITQKLADEQQKNTLAIEVSNMYLEDMTSRMDRFANAGINSAKIQEQITTELENQIKQIKLKNNPATEALEIEKATLEYINKQSDAYDKFHEARKRQLSDKGQADDGTAARQVMYDEARRLEDEFRRSLPDYISFVFNEIYAGMDAAIDSFVDKLFTGQKIYFKDLVDTFDNIIREESRKMVADQIKLLARSLITKVFGGEGVKTKEERLEEYQKTAALASKKALEYHSSILDVLINIDENIARDTKGSSAGVTKPDPMGNKDVKDIEKSILDKAADWIKEKVTGIFSNMGSNSDTNAGTYVGSDGVPEGGLTAAEHLPPLLEQSDSIFTKIMDSFGELGDFMSAGLSKVFGEDGIFGNLLGSMGSGLSSVFGQLGGMISQAFGGSSSGGDLLSGLVSTAASFFFANGGIMSEYGPLKLNKYASGGIANTPQVAIFGEGSKPEAYVPLPDGRNIPVKMQEGNNQKTQQQQVVNVTNNFTIQGNASRETQQEIARKVGMSINRSLQRNG